MKIIYLLLLVGLSISTPSFATKKIVDSTKSLIDYFPLKLSQKYSYSFSAYSIDGDELYSSSSKDSGKVHYVIVDSTYRNDSTIIWNVLEVHDFYRRRFDSFFRKDTSFKISDTSKLQLIEHISGMHKMICSGIVWQFPLVHLRDQINVAVFRFNDSINSIQVWNWNNIFVGSVSGSGSDSLFFSNTSGFNKRSFQESWKSGYYWGNSVYSSQLLSVTTAINEYQNLVPLDIKLFQNYPNPFNPSTMIKFQLTNDAYVSLKVFDILGSEVAVLVNGFVRTGEHKIRWNVFNISGGIYFYKLKSGNSSITKKLLYIK